MPDGSRPAGQIMYQINKAKTAAGGWVVTLMNNEGVDKTQSGIARADRRAHVDVVITSTLPVAAAKEYTQPRTLGLEKVTSGATVTTTVRVRIHPGDVQVVALT